MLGNISGVRKHSLAENAGIKPGEKLLSVCGAQVKDIIELSFYASDYEVELEIENAAGEKRLVTIAKHPDEDLGIEFESAVFDKVSTCYNNCIFCFVDQMIPGMRPGLYVRDDDYRLSFLYGNFITLNDKLYFLNILFHTKFPYLCRAQLLLIIYNGNTLTVNISGV